MSIKNGLVSHPAILPAGYLHLWPLLPLFPLPKEEVGSLLQFPELGVPLSSLLPLEFSSFLHLSLLIFLSTNFLNLKCVQNKKGALFWVLNPSGYCPVLLPFKAKLLQCLILSLRFFPVTHVGPVSQGTPTAFVVRLRGPGGCSCFSLYILFLIVTFSAPIWSHSAFSVSVTSVP